MNLETTAVLTFALIGAVVLLNVFSLPILIVAGLIYLAVK
jgi:hypothetical protein